MILPEIRLIKWIVLSVLILAGGESRRMGFPKLLLQYHDTTLLTHTILKAKAVSNDIVVVVGKFAELYQKEAEKSKVKVIENPEWSEGLASSLRVGLKSLDNSELALILLPDQPFVSVDHLQALIAKQKQTQSELVFSSYQGTLGAPTVIHHSLFDQVQTLRGNVGAKALIQDGVMVAEVELENSLDIDTPEDAERLVPINE
jgi:molybdenum cofactor cytidylyltransferase